MCSHLFCALAYTPDKLNRSSVTDNGVTTAYSHNALNQYGSVGGETLSYDGNFNLTHAPNLTSPQVNDGFYAVYDAANRLVSASYTGGPQPVLAEFVYDGLGRCVKRTIGGVATLFAYDGWKPIAEWNEWNHFQAWNVYGPGPDEILLRHEVKYGYLRFHTDRHGNVAFLLDNDGRVIEKYTYDAFGEPTITGAGGEPRDFSHFNHCFLFQGREYIQKLGVYDYRNRFYHPGLGRFLQTDPTGFDGGDINLFRYCGDDPIDLSDPTGLLAGFSQYKLVYDANEKLDATHDGYHVEGVRGTESRPDDRVTLEVDRKVTTSDTIGGKKGGDTNVTETPSIKGDTPHILVQIDVRYASGAGLKTREFTQNNEWTHSNDAINSANRLRGELAGWIRGQNMSPSAANNLVRDGGRFGRTQIPSMQQHRDSFMEDQRNKWDRPYQNGWRTPNGTLVAPHHPIDRYTGNPLEWNQQT